MPEPLIVDSPMHVYTTRERALWGKGNDEISEYGEKAGVHSSELVGQARREDE